MAESDHTIGRWLRDRAVVDPDRIAIDDRGVQVSYATLSARAMALAESLQRAGYEPGSRIGSISGNSIDHVVAFFACARAGVAFIPLSWRLTSAELSELLQRSRPDLVLIEDEHASLACDALRALEAREISNFRARSAQPDSQPSQMPAEASLGATGVEHHVPAARTPRQARPVRSDDPLLVIYTSGSESQPKGVVLTHASCFWTNLALSQAMPMSRDDVVLAILPQHHIAACNVQPLLAWWVGATVVLERSFQPDRVLQLIQERRVTTMMGVPTQYRMLLEVANIDSYDLSSLTRAVVGGSTTHPQLAEDWANRGTPLTQGSGLTEAAPNVLYLRPKDVTQHPGAVGRPYPSVDVRVVDPATGLTLEGAATGELWVRGPSLFAGYLDDREVTERVMHDGWLRTGDLVDRDAAGIYRVVERLKNIYVSGARMLHRPRSSSHSPPTLLLRLSVWSACPTHSGVSEGSLLLSHVSRCRPTSCERLPGSDWRASNCPHTSSLLSSCRSSLLRRSRNRVCGSGPLSCSPNANARANGGASDGR